MAPPAAARVFNITELTEGIFLNLPVQDVLLIQRVSRRFRDTIQGSRKLQQALFFTRLSLEPVRLQAQNKRIKRNARWAVGKDDSRSFGVFMNPLYYKLPKEGLSEIFARSEASWRKMLVCQPPAGEIALAKVDGRRRSRMLRHETGVTMEDLSGGEFGVMAEIRGDRWVEVEVAGDVVLEVTE